MIGLLESSIENGYVGGVYALDSNGTEAFVVCWDELVADAFIEESVDASEFIALGRQAADVVGVGVVFDLSILWQGRSSPPGFFANLIGGRSGAIGRYVDEALAGISFGDIDGDGTVAASKDTVAEAQCEG